MRLIKNHNKKNTLKVLFFASRPELNATSRYRINKLIPHLERAGIQCIVCPPFSNKLYSKLINVATKPTLIHVTAVSFFNRLVQLRHLRKCDIVVIQQELLRFFGPYFEYLIKLFNKRIIFDFDDANFALHKLTDDKPPSRFYDYSKTAKIIKLSDCVFAGSEYLKQYALQFTDNVVKIPTGIDIERYTPKSKYGQTPVIGWMGTSASLRYLTPMENVFSQLYQKGFDFSVKIVCNKPLHFKSFKMINKRWSLEDEVTDLNGFDIGIMPLPDDEFAQAKCGFKMIQYMAVGIPIVCSAVGENMIIGQDQGSCFLVHNEQQWIEKLSVLLADSHLRRTMGQRARRVVEAKYTVAKSAQQVVEIIRRL